VIPRVYQAISAVASALATDGVTKTRLNSRDNYLYRSIDDVLERLAPLLAKHHLCILPRVLEREATQRQDDAGRLLVAVTLRVAFDLVSAEDATSHTIEAIGEALDPGDKATAKAMQSAYKYAVLQAFCVPALQGEDADASSYKLAPPIASGEPIEGWPRWCDSIAEVVRRCEDRHALDAVKVETRPLLAALQRGNRALYRQIGENFAARSRALMEKANSGKSAEVASNGQLGKTPRRKRRTPAPTPGSDASRFNGDAAHG
jgi:hypothetical protein